MRDENYSRFPYKDTLGYSTLGYGRNTDHKPLNDKEIMYIVTSDGISKTTAEFLLDEDIDYFTEQLSKYLPFFDTVNDVRQIVLVDMCFNLGIKGLLEFQKMLHAVHTGDYNLAATEMIDSKWASQVGDRAKRLSKMMKTGVLEWAYSIG